jgi:hypothetical protein
MKLLNSLLALAMLVSLVFVGEITSTNNPLSVQARTQTEQVVVKRKKVGGLAGKTYRGGKWVYHKAANGTRYVYYKTKAGSKYVGRQTWKGGKWTYNKTKNGTKSVFHKTKKVIVGQ